MKTARLLLGVSLMLISLTALFSDDAIQFQTHTRPPETPWSVVTRYDYRVHINGTYQGFSNREIRETYRVQSSMPEGWAISGEMKVLGETRKNTIPVAAALEARANLDYTLLRDGEVKPVGPGHPVLRGFPSFPDGEIQPGDTWEAPLDFLVLGPFGEQFSLTQIASYRYREPGFYRGRPVFFIDVAWALRYRGAHPQIDAFLTNAEGSHHLNLVVDAQDMNPVFARDKFVETWYRADGTVEQRDGFALIFWDGIPPMNKESLRETIESRFTGTFDEIQETGQGLSLTLRRLQFQPDTAVLLAEDQPLLDTIAEILRGIERRTILVRGHAASVGLPEDEQQLSEERARFISNAMVSRGINPKRLIYEAVGSREPLASNNSEEGRRINRRVELLILED